MPTMREIAEAASVSVSTASLALNDKPRVSVDTRRKVMSIAASLGYQLGSLSHSTNFTHKRHIGIVYPKRVLINGTVTNLARDWMCGIKQSLEGNIGNLTTFGGCDSVDHDLMFQHITEEQQLHGVILIGIAPEDGYLEKVLGLGIPLVVLNRMPQRSEFSSVCMDNYGSGEVVAKYLENLGHKKVACVKEGGDFDFCFERNCGAEDAFNSRNMLELSFECNLNSSSSYKSRICSQIISSNATAVYFIGDTLAMECMEILLEMGVSIPSELTIIGFDNSRIPLSNGMRCTSVDFNKIEMGKTAGDILLQLMERSEICNVTTTFKTNMVVHDTCSPVLE